MAENKGKIRTVVISKSSSARESLENIVKKVDLLSFGGSFTNFENYDLNNSWEKRMENKLIIIEGALSVISDISARFKANNPASKVIYVVSEAVQRDIPRKTEELYEYKCIEAEALSKDVNERRVDGIFSFGGFIKGLGEKHDYEPITEHALKRRVFGFNKNREIERELKSLMIGGGSLANSIIRQLIGKPYCKSFGWYSEFNSNLGEEIENIHGIPDGGEKIFQVNDLGSYVQSIQPDVIFIARGARTDQIDLTKSRSEINTQLTIKSRDIMNKTYETLMEAKPKGLKVVFTNLPGVYLYDGFRKLGNSSKWTSFSSDSDRLRRIIYNTLVSKNDNLSKTLVQENIFVPVLGEHADEVVIGWECAKINGIPLEQAVQEMGLKEIDLNYFIKRDESFCRSIVEFGNLIKSTARKTNTNDYDVASSVEKYIAELAFYSTGSKMPWYSYVSRDRLKALMPYAQDFSLEGAYLMLPARITHQPTIRIDRDGSFDLKELPQRMKVKLGRAMMRQNDLVKAIS